MTPASYPLVSVGPAQFGPADACLIALAMSIALVSALRLWRMGRREDREARLATLRATLLRDSKQAERGVPPWYRRVTSAIPGARLVRSRQSPLGASPGPGAGSYGSPGGVTVRQVCGGLALADACLLLLWFFHAGGGLGILAAAAAFFGGWRVPNLLRSRFKARRRRRLDRGLPDALDLLVVCVEAGLSLDQAIEQVSRDLRRSSREVAEEFAITAAEMRVLPDRSQALQNLARRTGLASLRGIIVVLNQSIRFGTPLAAALRVLSRDLRVERLARFEERAARLPVLLSIPLMALILPSLLAVIGAPLALRIVDALRSIAERSH